MPMRLHTLASHLHTQQQHARPSASGAAGPRDDPTPVSILSAEIGGHVHPSICRADDGALVVAYAQMLDDSNGQDVLMCSRSENTGATWSTPVQIAATRKHPGPSLRDTGTFEIYPGTINTLPDGRILLTWQYIATGDPEYKEGALCSCISGDAGRTWGPLKVITDPADPPDPKATDSRKRHLGAMRHGVLPWPDGRWLLPLRDPPADFSPWGPRLYDEKTGAVERYAPLTRGGEGARPEVNGPIKQVVRTADGSLLAMSAGGPYTPKGDTVEGLAPVLHYDGTSWTLVEGFPAGMEPPPGTALADWDDDGDREGRFLTPLSDGRVVVTWVYAHDPMGIHYNVSSSGGKVWDAQKTVTMLKDTPVIGRYYSPRTVQLDAGTLGTVFMNRHGVHYVTVSLDGITA